MSENILRLIGIEIFNRWTSMWNLDLNPAEIMAPQFTLRYAQAGGELFDDISTPQQFAEVINIWHQKRPGIVFKTEGEAVVDLTEVEEKLVGLVACPYFVSFNGEDGRKIARSGIDILRICDGLICEVWSVSSGKQGRTFYPLKSEKS